VTDVMVYVFFGGLGRLFMSALTDDRVGVFAAA
jgi:hypothetical protein